MRMSLSIVLYLALIGLISGAPLSFAEVVPPVFKSDRQDLGKACVNSVMAGNQKCFALSRSADGAQAASATSQVAAVDPNSVTQAAGTGASVAQTSATVASIVANACHKAVVECKSACTQATESYHSLVAQTPTTDPRRALYSADMESAGSTPTLCSKSFGEMALAKAAEAGMSASAMAQFKDTLNASMGNTAPPKSGIESLFDSGSGGKGFFDSTAGKVALGVGGAFAVKEIFFDNKDDGGDGGEEERRRAAAADPECKSDRAPEFDHCQKFLREYLCANPANMGDMRCEKWSNNYCGFKSADTADANGQTASALPPPPPGAGTQLCQDTLAFRYCQGANRTSCYSCVSQRDRISAQCQANPASCIRTPSNEEMAHFKASCGDDPVFSLPQWAHIQPAINTNPPPGQPPVDGTTGNVTITGGLMGGSRVPTQAAAASLPADISPLYSPSVVAQAANTVRALCEQGRLNNCGRSN